LKYFFNTKDDNINNNPNTNNTLYKEQQKFTYKSNWVPPDNLLPPECLSLTNFLDEIFTNHISFGPWYTEHLSKQHGLLNRDKANLSSSHKQAIKNLSKQKQLIFKPADKGNSIVIMNREDYKNEALKQLNDPHYYKPLNEPLQPNTTLTLNKITNQLLKKGFITQKQHLYLKPPNNPRPRHFYILPKIHKPTSKWPSPNIPPCRPIISNCSSESSNLSRYLDNFLKPIATKHPSYLTNSQDFISKIRDQKIEPTDYLVTCDVSSLYTNMKLHRTMDIVKEAFTKYPDPLRPTNLLLQLLNIILHKNDFQFDNQFYLQTTGIAMGLSAAPSLADLYMTPFDEMAREGFHIKPKLYYRYLDDIFFIFSGTEDELNQYLTFLNNLIPGIVLEMSYNLENINFLDITIFKYTNNENCTLQTKTYFKETDTHSLLHKFSYHPKHTFHSIITSQILRFKRNSSFKIHFDQSCKILFYHLKHRGYNFRTLKNIKNKVWFDKKAKRKIVQNTPSQSLTTTNTPVPTKFTFPIIFDYNSFGRDLIKSYKEKLNTEPFFNNYRFVAAFNRNRNIGDTLIHSKFT